MEKSPQLIHLHTEKESSSPLPLKRLRLDCTVTSDPTRINCFELLKLASKTAGSPSADTQQQQLQATTLNITSITKVTHSHTGPLGVCFLKAERHFVALQKDEQPSVIQSDDLSSYRLDDAGGILAEYHTSVDIGADCEVGKSLHGRPSGDDAEGRRGQNTVSQIQTVTLTVSDREVRCQPDCTYEDIICDYGYSHTPSQPADIQDDNQKRGKYGSGENILCDNGNDEGCDHVSPSECEDSKSSVSEVSLSINCKEEEEEVKHGEEILGFQRDEKENDRNGVCDISNCTAATSAGGSSVSSDEASVGVITAVGSDTSVSHETDDDLCGAKEKDSADATRGEAQSETDCTTGTRPAARTGGEPAGGDNEAGPFSVIDPAVWSDTDREPEEKWCNSETAAGVESSPSEKPSMVESSCPLCPSVGPSQCSTGELSPSDRLGQLNNRGGAQQCEEEKEGRVGIVRSNDTQCCKTGSEGGFQWKSSSPCRSGSSPPAGDETEESSGTTGRLLKELEEPERVRVNSDLLNAEEVEDLGSEIIAVEAPMEIKAAEDVRSLKGEIKPDTQPRDDTSKVSACYCDEAESDTRLTRLGSDTPNETERSPRHPNGADVETEERRGARRAGGELERERDDNYKGSAESEPQQKEHKARDVAESSPRGRVSEWTEGAKSECATQSWPARIKGGNKLHTPSFLALALPPSEAVVPNPRHLSHRGLINTANLICNDRFPPAPSAFALPGRAPGGFDTFEKIQLSPDVDDDGGGGGPPFSSLSGQLLKTSDLRLHRSMPGGESHRREETPEHEGGGGEGESEERVGGAEDTGGSETGANSQPGQDSYKPKFEMKKQFDLVLKELSLYFQITLSSLVCDSGASPPEPRCHVSHPVHGDDPSDCKHHLSSPELGHHGNKSSDDGADEDRRLDPLVSRVAGSRDGEQEVPEACSDPSQEASMYPARKTRESRETELKTQTWSPSSVPVPSLEQRSHRAPEQPRRLEPLRTCSRPIRVGLSKRAKTKQLHHPRPSK